MTPTLAPTTDRPGIIRRFPFSSVGRTAGFIIATALLFGCVTGVEHSVEYLTDQTYPPRNPATEIEWLDMAPSRPHVKLARTVVSSVNVDFDGLRKDLLNRARALGADAVIAQRPAEVSSKVGSPNFEAGQFGPKGTDFNLYGYGWYTPNTSNPYLLTQGATDQPRVDRYLAGVAIRYTQNPSH